MKLNSDHLKTFVTVCRTRNISKAAESLGLTQAALSIRIKKLEDSMERTLLVRNKSGVTLTEAGQDLLRYAESLEGMEKEFLGDLSPLTKDKLTGTIRVACFSTIGRSYVLPSLHPLLKNHPLSLNFYIKELRELPPMLQSGEADFVFMDQEIKKSGVNSLLLGHERYVLTKGREQCEDFYLSHDEEDMMTHRYLEATGKKNAIVRRRFVDEIYSAIDGVASGLGQCVMPEHLIKKDPRIKIVNRKEAVLSPVYLCFRERPYQNRLFTQTLEILKKISL